MSRESKGYLDRLRFRIDFAKNTETNFIAKIDFTTRDRAFFYDGKLVASITLSLLFTTLLSLYLLYFDHRELLRIHRILYYHRRDFALNAQGIEKRKTGNNSQAKKKKKSLEFTIITRAIRMTKS